MTIELDQEVAALLETRAADAQVSEGVLVERALRAMELRSLVQQIRSRSDLDEHAAARLASEELRAVRSARLT